MTVPQRNASTAKTLRSALFVDFDNVFSGLQRLDSSAAKAFSEDPARWVQAFAAGQESEGLRRRRFLIQRCYLNPVTHSRFRPNFTRAGFQVVDCPSLTQQGKSSADINLVLDAMDALAASTRFDEFMILSADADFTPLIHRCRADDRLVTIMTPGPAAAAYRAVADTVIGADPFIGLLTDEPGDRAELQLEGFGGLATAPPSAVDELRPVSPDAAMNTVKDLLARAERPVSLALAADVAQRADPGLKASQWGGNGSFGAWLRETLPDVAIDNRTPGYVWDPARFTEADVPVAADASSHSELHRQVAALTDIPLLDQSSYRELLDRLTFDLATAPYHRSETSKRVRDACAESASRISRSAVTFVINGLLFANADLDDEPSAVMLAEIWTRHVLGLCEGARMELSNSDVSDIVAWVSGGLVERSPQ